MAVVQPGSARNAVVFRPNGDSGEVLGFSVHQQPTDGSSSTADGEAVMTLKGHYGSVNCCCWRESALELYTAGADGLILCWRPRLGNSPTYGTTNYTPAPTANVAARADGMVAGGRRVSAADALAAVGAGVFGTTGGATAAAGAGEDEDDWSSDDDAGARRARWVPPVLRRHES
jgi:hypothetical protein